MIIVQIDINKAIKSSERRLIERNKYCLIEKIITTQIKVRKEG